MFGRDARYGGLVGCDLNDIHVPTPSMIIDQVKLIANCERGKRRAEELGVTLRPHLKTHKSIEIARAQMLNEKGPATVSTMTEARYFAANGVMDLIYAVGISPQKLPIVSEIRATGVDLKIVLDSVEAARLVSKFCRQHAVFIPCLIEIDCDGHRSGLRPNDPTILEIVKALTDGAVLRGVITHAGESYKATSLAEMREAAKNEAKAANEAAEYLRANGHRCEIVSTGSSPTFFSLEDATGITEMRAGVYVMGDLFMSNLGVVRIEDIAGTVLTTVIGHQAEKGQVICDAGWCSLSQDRGTGRQAIDYGYGLVCDIHGVPLRKKDIRVVAANQEHGIIEAVAGKPLRPEDFPIGSRLRIMPIHVCSTMAMHHKLLFIGTDETIFRQTARAHGWE